jgi:hypothetical protein
MEKAIMGYNVFICYETDTAQDLAFFLAEFLEKKYDIKAFVAARPGNIPYNCPDEHEFRLQVIRECDHFIFLVTDPALDSDPVAEEVTCAIENKKSVIICPFMYLDISHFNNKFPKIKLAQRGLPFENKNDLARKVDPIFRSEELSKKTVDKPLTDEIQTTTRLIVEPSWSVNGVLENTVGHIIFTVRNLTGKKVVLYGYRIFRISPDGAKDYYYKRDICEADQFMGWGSDQHFRVILFERDEHIFHWEDVNIPKTYGINRDGIWQTEVQIAYLEEGSNTFYYSIGKTTIKYLKSKGECV